MPYYFFQRKNVGGSLPRLGLLVESIGEDDAWFRAASWALGDGEEIEDWSVRKAKGSRRSIAKIIRGQKEGPWSAFESEFEF